MCKNETSHNGNINPTYKYRNLLLSSYAAYSIDLCLKYFFTLSGVFVSNSICCSTLFCNMSLFLGDFLADIPCFNPDYAIGTFWFRFMGKSHSPMNHFRRFLVSAIFSLSVSPALSKYAPMLKVR